MCLERDYMSDNHSETAEVIAKELTLKIIDKYTLSGDKIEEVCKVYDRIHKQVIESNKKNYSD